MQQSNTPATVSLVSGIGAVLLMFVGYCGGIVPIVGPLVAFVLMPVEWLLAFVGILSGIVGYRTAAVLDGTGRGSAVAGVALSVVFMALQALLWTLACFGVGTMLVMDGL